MKIVSLHVKCFGKLKNFRLNFQSGLNVMQQDNGFGKSTLAAFIRAMLYGFKYTKKLRGSESTTDVALWQTWNSTEKIGGSMVVSHDGETYRIERYFGSTAKQETLSVTNEKSGKDVTTLVGNVGEYFLGLNAESYDRSAYYPQEAVEITSTENFETRLAGLVQNAENYDRVQETLRKYRKNLKYEKGNGGEIYNLEEQRLAIQRKIFQCTQAENRRREIDCRLQQIDDEYARLQRQQSDCQEKIAALQKKVAKSELSEEQKENQRKLAQLKEKIAAVGDLEKDKALCDQLYRQIEQTPEAGKVQHKANKPLLIVGLLLLLAGIGLCFVHIIAGLATAVVGVVLGVLCFFVGHKPTTLPSGEKDVLITQYFNVAQKYVYCNGLGYQEVHKQLWQLYNQFLVDKRVYEALSQTAKPADTQSVAVVEELQQYQQQLTQIQRTQEQLSRELGSITEERKGLDTNVLPWQEKLDETEQLLLQARHSYQVAAKVSELLLIAKENLSTSYLPKLCLRCQTLLNQITNGDYQLVADRNFRLQLRENGVTKALDNFSRGIREITLLCFRVALSELLYDGEIPFLIVDDAFVNYDEANFLRATQLLKQLSAKTQVVYFTCHARLGNLL